MLKDFFRYLKNKKLFNRYEKILLTVSGGLDSMVMAELFRRAEHNFSIAHCNFNLRGSESDGDEEFVMEYCRKYNIPYFIKHFETIKFAKDKKISIQMAARNLRYEWFEYLCNKEGFNYYATAHHKDDEIETFFINLLRGTGIAGLHGILPKQGRIIRPLLFAGRAEIEEYARKINLNFREDSSNSEVKYLRNNIRHRLLPVLKEIESGYRDIITGNIERIRKTEIVYRIEIDRLRKEVSFFERDLLKISISALRGIKSKGILLFEILSEYGFNFAQIKDILNSLDGTSGKTFYSDTHILVKDRNDLIITKQEEVNDEIIEIFPNTSFIVSPLNIRIGTIEKTDDYRIIPDPAFALLDKFKLIFPLKVRKWKQGDFFYPLGMKNKKKLSDFFIDEKFSIVKKQKTYVLTSGNDIVWIIGHRIDDRYKITATTVSVLELKLLTGDKSC